MKDEDLDWWAQNPYNLYECFWCGQHYKCNDDPENVLKETCFRCHMGLWEIRQGSKKMPAYKTWKERCDDEKNRNAEIECQEKE